MVTGRPGEIVLDSKRYRLQDPKRWQKQPVLRAARKIGGGDTKYSDYDLWNVKAWSTWHLGRGEEYFETDGRYYDSWNAETRVRGQITLGPHIYPTGVAADNPPGYESGTAGGANVGQQVGGATVYALAESFETPSGGFTADMLVLYMKKIGSPVDVVACIYTDVSSSPGALVSGATKTLTAASFSADYYEWIEFDWTGTVALTASTTYWIVVYCATVSETAYYKVGEDTAAGYADGVFKYSTTANAWTWATQPVDLWFRLEGAEGELSGIPVRFAFFNDNGTDKLFCAAGSQVYAWNTTGDGYWENDGADTGVTDEAFTGNGKNDMTTGGYYTGTEILTYKVVIDSTNDPDTFKWSIDDGDSWEAETVDMTGSAQALSNGMTITFAATTGHTDTEYWEFSVGLITDMQVFGDSLVVAQGTLDELRKKQSGSWDDLTDGEEGYKLGLGICPTGGDAGKVVLIKSGPDSGTDRHKARCIAAIGDTWQDLKSADGSDTIVGDSSADITWIGQYQGSVWFGKEDGVSELGRDGIAYNKFPFFTQKASWNFEGTSVWHRNELILPAAYGLWSFDGRTLKNIGPGIALTSPHRFAEAGYQVGLPTNRQGNIKDTLPTVNALYVAMDSSISGQYSSIMLWTGRGWHEVVRGQVIAKAIRALGYTPANTIETESRLWYGYDKNVFYAILPDTTDDPFQWASSKYDHAGHVEFGWFNAGLFEVDKDWRSVTIEAENVDASQRIEVTYKLDDDTTQTSLGTIDDGTIGTAISNNQATLSFGTDTYGKRIKLYIYLATNDPDETPKVTNVKLKYWKVPDPAYGWNLTLKLTEGGSPPLDRSWRTQQTDFKTTFEKKEPVTLVDPYGASHTVRLDNLAETIVATDVGEPKGCLITVRAVEA